MIFSFIDKFYTCKTLPICSDPLHLAGDIYCYQPCIANVQTTGTSDTVNMVDTTTSESTTITTTAIEIKDRVDKLNSELKIDRKTTSSMSFIQLSSDVQSYFFNYKRTFVISLV